MNLVTVWNATSIEAASAQVPAPYQLGTPSALSIVVTNNSPYTVGVYSGGNKVNEVPGNSQVTLPTVAEMSLQLDPSHPSIYVPVAPEVTLTYLNQASAYSLVALSPDVATQVTGSVSASISGPVSAMINGPVSLAAGTTVQATITNSSLNVSGTVNANITNASINANVTGSVNATITNANLNVQVVNTGSQSIPITGTVTANLAAGSTINATITNTTLTVALAAGSTVNAAITNSNVPVTISGTPTVNATIQNATLPVTGSVSITATQAIPITNDSGGVLQVGGTMNVNVQNASLPVTGNVTVNATTALPIKNESGGTIQVGGTVNASITNSTLNVSVTGTPTVNATIQNASIAVTGTVTANLAAGSTVNANITNSSLTVALAAGSTINATITNSSVPVTISGTPAVNANITNSNLTVNLAAGASVNASITGTPTVNLASGTSVNVNTGTVNIGNTPGVNVQQQPAVSGQGYHLLLPAVPVNQTGGIFTQAEFLPSSLVTQIKSYVFRIKGGLANTNYQIHISFSRLNSDGSHTIAQGFTDIESTFTTDASGNTPDQYISLSQVCYLGPMIANGVQVSAVNQTNSSDHTPVPIELCLSGETQETFVTYTKQAAWYHPTQNSYFDTGLPMFGCTKIKCSVGLSNNAASSQLMYLRPGNNAQNMHLEVLSFINGSNTQDFELDFGGQPFDPTTQNLGNLQFLFQFTAPTVYTLNVTLFYKRFLGQIMG